VFRRLILYLAETRNCLLDSSNRARATAEKLYTFAENPFGFDRELEQFRFERAMQMILEASNGNRFDRGLEVGCSEGMFTKLMAGCCTSVVALDLSSIAVERAKRRCGGLSNIVFGTWDARQDEVSGTYDLIVATGVLEYIYRPSTLKQACEKLVRALRPGGYLLLGNTVAGNDVENTWIGKMLIRGTLINDYMIADGRLETLSRSLDQCVCPFEHVLLRRRKN
jgi:2-polyprenyl-3-methyl-5-hydroxy-6-metoxy-1,4-benzoquinol methylase